MSTVLVDADYHQFLICDAEGEALTAGLGDETLAVTYDAEDAPDLLAVVTGTQAGDVEVMVGAPGTEPPLPGSEWEDVVEVSVWCTSGLAVTPLMDAASSVTVALGGGGYRIRISARGRDQGLAQDAARDDDGAPLDTAQVVEHYLIQAWPDRMRPPTVHRLTSQVATTWGTEEKEPAAPGEAAGLAGGRLVGAALDGLGPSDARRRDGLGGFVLDATLTGTRRRLFPILSFTCGCFADYSYSGTSEYVVGNENWINAHRTEEEGGDLLTGSKLGNLVLTIRTWNRPRTATIGWNWWLPIDARRPWADTRHLFPVLAEDSVVDLAFTQQPDADGTTRTRLEVNHTGLPDEWVRPMEDWWRWRLALAEQRGYGTH